MLKCTYTDLPGCLGEMMTDEMLDLLAAEGALWEMAVKAPDDLNILEPILDKAYEVQRKRITVETALGYLAPCSACKESK